MKQYIKYASKMVHHMNEMFMEEDNENYIDLKELKEEDVNAFLHALFSVMPTHYLNQITTVDASALEANHLANKLCFQFMKK